MTAKSVAELTALTETEYAKLRKSMDQVTQTLAMLKDSDDTSIKDVIAHRAHWIDLFLGWYRDGLAGKTVHFPAPGYKWNQLPAYNAELRRTQADWDWRKARQKLKSRHKALLHFLDTHGDPDLYAGPMQGGNNAWTPGRWAEASGPSHYRSARKYISTRMRDHQRGLSAVS